MNGMQKSYSRTSGVSWSEIKDLALNIPEDKFPAIQRSLDTAFKIARRVSGEKPALRREALRALSKAADNHCRHLKDLEAEGLRRVAFSYEQDIHRHTPCEGDPKSQANEQLLRDCQAVRRLARHVARACRQWDRLPFTNMQIKIDGQIIPIEKALPSSGHSKPHDGIIVEVIYNIWINILDGVPVVREHSPFVNFAYKVFGLTGEPTCLYQTMRKRLQNKSYQRFHRKLRGVRTPSGKIAAEK
jgi:hypothetical protein